MLQPKRTKYRKQMKGRNRGLAQRGNMVSFGEFGLKALERGRLTARQIEAARRAMTRHVKRGGKIWIRVFPDKPITQKPLEVRQGKGKGSVEYWVAQIQPGKVLFEMEGVTRELAIEAFDLAKAKLDERETFLKSLPASGQQVVNEDTGETYKIYPPLKSSTTSVTVKLL